MTQADLAALIGRLRATGGKGQGGPLKWEAATALETLAAENAKLKVLAEAARRVHDTRGPYSGPERDHWIKEKAHVEALDFLCSALAAFPASGQKEE